MKPLRQNDKVVVYHKIDEITITFMTARRK